MFSTPLTASGEISFDLLSQVSKLSSCSITGDRSFSYNGDGSLKNSNATTITLTANVANCSITAWQY
jgi:hypothetical protein